VISIKNMMLLASVSVWFTGCMKSPYEATKESQINIPSFSSIVVSPKSFEMNDDSELKGTIDAISRVSGGITYRISKAPLHGRLVITESTGEFSYIPGRGFYGNDSFEIFATVGSIESAPAKMDIKINPLFTDADLALNASPNCAADPIVNTCLFWKNPVAQNKAPLAAPITATSNLSALTTHSVNIMPDWYDSSGFLKNLSIDVYADTLANVASRVSTAGANFKFSYGNDPKHQLSQVMAFYWLNMQIKYMTARVGNFFARDKNLRVFAWDNSAGARDNAYYATDANEMHMGIDSTTGNENALGAEIILHEMGHANVDHATNRLINQLSSATHKFCVNATDGNVCCTGRLGCSFAMNEGQADYHSIIMFDSDPALGQHITNTINGLASCGISRNSVLNSAITADTVLGACGNNGFDVRFNGEVHVVGSLYASIWFELRKRAKLVNAAEVVLLDKLFNEHLKIIRGNDTFSTIYDKIIAIDTSLFASRFATSITAEFRRRLIIP